MRFKLPKLFGRKKQDEQIENQPQSILVTESLAGENVRMGMEFIAEKNDLNVMSQMISQKKVG